MPGPFVMPVESAPTKKAKRLALQRQARRFIDNLPGPSPFTVAKQAGQFLTPDYEKAGRGAINVAKGIGAQTIRAGAMVGESVVNTPGYLTGRYQQEGFQGQEYFPEKAPPENVFSRYRAGDQGPTSKGEAFGRAAASFVLPDEKMTSYDIDAALSSSNPFLKAAASTGAFLPAGEFVGRAPSAAALKGLAREKAQQAPAAALRATERVSPARPAAAMGEGVGKARRAKVVPSKESWQMTQEEFFQTPEGKPTPRSPINVKHRQAVEQALAEGKPVPYQVVKQYPDIGARLSPLEYVRTAYPNAQSADAFPSLAQEHAGLTTKPQPPIVSEAQPAAESAVVKPEPPATAPAPQGSQRNLKDRLAAYDALLAKPDKEEAFRTYVAGLGSGANRPLRKGETWQARFEWHLERWRKNAAQEASESVTSPVIASEIPPSRVAANIPLAPKVSQAPSQPKVSTLPAAETAAPPPKGTLAANVLNQPLTPPVPASQAATAPPSLPPQVPPSPGAGGPPAQTQGVQGGPPVPPSVTIPPPPGVPPQAVPLPPLPPPIPPRAAGRVYVGDLRAFSDDVAEVVTSDNPVVRWAAGKTGINPSILAEGDVGKAVVAYHRQGIEADQLIESALSALDAQAQAVTGRQRGLPLDANGFLKGTGKLWNDVFSTPGQHTLTPETQRYVDTYLKIVDEAEAFRVAEGLQPLSRRGPEGWFYVPRQVKEKRGIVLRKPSSAKLSRFYDEATDGFARGIKYDADPRATLESHLRAAYREVIEKRMSDALVGQSIPPSALVPKPIANRLLQAARNLGAAEKAARQAFQAQSKAAGNAPMPSTFQRHVYQDPAVIVAREEARRARGAYSLALKTARRAETADAALFGKGPGEIAIAQWRNRYFPRAEADQLKEGLDAKFERTETFGKIVNTIRSGASVLDVAAPFIQGLPVLGRNPVAWSRATKNMYWTLLNPAARGRYVDANRPLMQEMARLGIPLQETEFFSGTRVGTGLPLGAPIGAIPKVGAPIRRGLQQVGKQTYGRFQESYGAFLLTARTELYKGFKGHLGPDDAATMVRNMTGGLESKALGVGPDQRSVEAIWMAFSPKYLRSTAALFQDATKLGTPRGREAARTLAQTAGGVVALYIAAGVGMGKSEEEIIQGLNPLGGKKFLSYNVNGDWVGVGSQVYSISRFLAEIASLPLPGGKPAGDILATNRFDNPIVSFSMSRAAPGVNIVMTLLEAATGRDLVRAEVQNLPDLLRAIGTSALPFVVQANLEGQQTATLVAAETGARTSPMTKAERGGQQVKKPLAERLQELQRAQQKSLTPRAKPDRFRDLAERYQQRQLVGTRE